MTPERWKQIEEVFQAALDLPAEERRAYVAEACAGDEELCAQVEALVAAHEEAGDFIEAPAIEATGLGHGGGASEDGETPTTAPFDDPAIGRRVGAYRIVREIGRGGMGAVYLAERADSEFRRRVAIKLIKRGMDTDFILRRFRHERQILASLDHPHIARLLDGGTTHDGLPYFVMEFIEGLPVYRFCDEQKLTVPERLRLFCQVCDAVNYAHRQLVIHRDIKPSNILVTAEGVPKLLDFGIAKVLNPELAADITNDPTATATRMMTPEYASPEQVQGMSVTPATDVYSLGVLLYELLTGHRPYRLRHRPPHEVARVICEEEPPQPSVVLTRPEDLLPAHPSDGETATLKYLYWNRGATVETLRQELKGDLDNIVMKALAKEPRGRYQSAEQLREDVTRHLDGRPVSAPPAAARRAPPAAAEPVAREESLAVLPLKLLDAGREGEAEVEYLGVGLADALITRLSQLRRFAVRPTSSVLRYGGDSDPLAAGRELGAAFVLDGRIRRAGAVIRVTVQLLEVAGGAAVWAGQFDEQFTDVLQLEDAISLQVAEAIVPQLTGGERLRLQKRGTDNPRAHESYLRGRFHWNTFTEEGFARAITFYYDAIAHDPGYAVAYAGVAEYYNWLGIYGVLPFRECSAAAFEAASKAVELDPALAEAHAALGQATLCRDGDWGGGEAQLLRAIELNPNYALAHLWYSFQLEMEGRFDEALREGRRAAELDPLAVITRYNVAWCLYQSRRYDDGVALCRQMLAAEPGNGMTLYCLSALLSRTGRHAEAVSAAAESAEMLGRAGHALARLGAAYAEAGRAGEAESVLREMEETAARRYVSPYHLAVVRCSLGHAERALELLEQAHAEGDAWLLWMGVEPQLDPLRGDPRFKELLRRTNNPAAARRASGAAVAATAATPATSASPDAPVAATVSAPRPTEDEEAYQLYVAGHYFATRRTAEAMRQAVERLERAVERDPKFALAWSELADCYALLNWYVEPPPADAWGRAKEAALRAVEADDTLADAHASLGFVRLNYDHDFAAAEREFRRAVALKADNAVAHRWYAFSLSAMGRHDQAVAEIRRAQEISPRSPVIATAFANVLFFAQRYEEAVEQCRRALELDPGSISTHIVLRWSYEMMGRCEEAVATCEQERAFTGDTPNTRAKRAHVLAACGRSDEAREILSDLVARRDEQWVTAYEVAVIYGLLGERDEAFAWLSRAGEEHAVGLTYVRVDPRLNSLRADPRFGELLQSFGAPPQ